jgi:alpha-ketoglutarate-dependent taurine dioxygenase
MSPPFILQRDAEPSGVDGLLERWHNAPGELDAALHRAGAVLFRGFAIDRQELFGRLVTALERDLLEYVDGNSPRTKVGAGVYTSTEYPPDYFISLHNELSYSRRWPARLFFCCITPPDEGGETPLCDGRALLAALPADLVERFRARGVRYVRNLHSGRGFGPSWQTTFQTTDHRVVEDHAQATGMELRWLDDGTARLSNTRPATTRHPVTGDEVWFNQADQFHPSTHPRPIYDSILTLYRGREEMLPQDAQFGDGSSIPLDDLTTIRGVTRRCMTRFAWQRGDLLMVDNVLVSHGRMPFRGPRKVLVAMTAR